MARLPLQSELPWPLSNPLPCQTARPGAGLPQDCVPAASQSSRAGVRAQVSGSVMGRGSNAPVPLNGPCEKLMPIPGAGGRLEGFMPGPVGLAAC